MKIIELRRHSIKIGPGDTDLSEQGERLARKVGNESLRGKGFTHLFVSTLARTTATLIAFREGAGDFPDIEPVIFVPHVDVGETDECMKLWQGSCHGAEQRGEDMLVCTLRDEGDLSRKIAGLAAESFKAWAKELPDECHALVVGHSPFLELIILSLFGRQIKQFQPCEGCIIRMDGPLHLESELRII